jgi:hypothetical protein
MSSKLKNGRFDKRVCVEYLKQYLETMFDKGKEPPKQIEEIQMMFFNSLTYVQVYDIVRLASEELEHGTGGLILYRHNIWEGVWRFHAGKTDWITLLYAKEQQVGGRLFRQNIDYGFGKILVPDIVEDIKIEPTPILTTSPIKIAKIRSGLGGGTIHDEYTNSTTE